LLANPQIFSILQISHRAFFRLVRYLGSAMIFRVNRNSARVNSLACHSLGDGVSVLRGSSSILHSRFSLRSRPCRAGWSRRSGVAKVEASREGGFTLIELLVVMGIISLLLVAVIPVVNSLSKSSGRKAAISNLLGAIEQAHSQAIKDGQATYVVFPTFTTGSQPTLDRYHYKSYAIFEDDPAAPMVPKQLTNWKTLPVGVALRSSGSGSLAGLTASTALTPAFTPAFRPDTTATAAFQCIKFNSSGEVESPANNVVLTVFEGYVNTTNEVATGNKDGSGNPSATESINIARLTGRAVWAQ
jgi:prepilin-type N-terminal cleavage/methylation domain-containing protein